MPLGPLMVVVGVWSSMLNDSIFLVALVGSLPPVAANAWAYTCRLRLVVMVTGSDQAVEVAFGGGQRGVDGVGRRPRW